MNNLMQEGGMADDGMTKEPVTGNDIPPGALASEVRDDVDTKLSGGEYVVPADVLRYYGVRFFEDLRSQAKQGMMEMESAGRIGGVPVDPRGVPMQGQDEELTPEEEQMLAQAMSGMAEGGTVFNREDFTMPETKNEAVVYFNPSTGKKQTIQFFNGVAMGLGIPPGFVPWTQELQDAYSANKLETPKSSSNDNNRNDNTITPDPTSGYSSWADQNYEAITSNPYDFGMNALKKPDDTTGLAGGLIGIITGKDKDIQNIANANAALKLMEAKGLTGSEQYKTLTESVKSYISQISPLEQGLILTKVAGTGNGYLKAIEERQKEKTTTTTPVTTAAPTDTTNTSTGGSNKSNKDEDKPVDQQAAYNQPRPLTMGSQAPVPKPTSTQGGSNTYSSSTYGSGSASYTPPTPKPTSAPPLTRSQANQFTSLAEGGLVPKPKKPRAKTKGLAGKQ